MQVSLIEYLNIIKVVRMLYGVDLAQQLFESTYKQFGFTFQIDNAKLVLPRDSNQENK